YIYRRVVASVTGNMQKTVLLTLGRLPKALELARALHSAGCRVLVADPFSTHLARPSRSVAKSFRVTAPNNDLDAFHDDLFEIINSETVDLIIPVSEEALYVSLLRPRLPDHATIFGPSFGTLQDLHNKHRFQEIVAEAGLTPIPTASAKTSEALALSEANESVVKPILGCSGTGLAFFEQGQVPPPSMLTRDNLVQKRIRGREICCQTIARKGEVLGTVLYEGLAHSGTVAVSFSRVDDAPQVEAWIEQFVRHLNFDGFIAFDFIIDEDGMPWPLECNPRLTSGIHFMDHADLAAGALGLDLSQPIRVKSATRFQEGHTALLTAYGDILKPVSMFRQLGRVFSTPDVLWRWSDPLPFLLMTPMSWPVLKQVMFDGVGFGEAATSDVEWREPARATMSRLCGEYV
ncbi:MAG: ATP-grasp domain-containing protein, partial [Pseudomonadota bacterium]